jgi:DNA-binding transcriptional ArsR family regulator
MTRQGITKHLEILADAGLLDDRRRGRERIWQIREDRIEEARRCLDRISRQWDEALGRLREFVERKP